MSISEQVCGQQRDQLVEPLVPIEAGCPKTVQQSSELASKHVRQIGYNSLRPILHCLVHNKKKVVTSKAEQYKNKIDSFQIWFKKKSKSENLFSFGQN